MQSIIGSPMTTSSSAELWMTTPVPNLASSFMNSSYNISVDGENTTNGAVEQDKYYFYVTEQLTFLSVMFVIIVVGNSAVLVALSLSKGRKSRMSFFIMQLALADLSVGLIHVLTDIIWKLTVTWEAGNIMCKLVRYLCTVVTFASTYVLVALSIDRYDAISHPMNFSGSWRRARILVATAWLLSFTFSIPSLIFNNESLEQGRLQCWIHLKPWEWQLYLTLVSFALFFIPTIIIMACYTIIVCTIWSKSKLLTTTGKHARHRKSADSRCSTDEVDSRRASSRGLIPKAKIKTVKMTFVIIVVFIVCWSPYFIYSLCQVYGYVKNNQTNIAISTFIGSLTSLNSAANPIIYCLFSTHICRNLRRIRLFNWLADALWLRRAGRPESGAGLLRGRGTEYSSVSDALSRSTTPRSSRASKRVHYALRPLNGSTYMVVVQQQSQQNSPQPQLISPNDGATKLSLHGQDHLYYNGDSVSKRRSGVEASLV